MPTTSVRHTLRLTAGLTIVAVLALAPPAEADPVVGEGGHSHHLTTGNGSCLDVGAVTFLAEARGLHRGANASGTDHGPWHGSC